MNLINSYESLEADLKDLLPEDVQLNEDALKVAFIQRIDEESSWLIKFITLIGGFLGATFLLGFIMAIIYRDGPILTMTVGLILFSSVLWMSRVKESLMLYTLYVTIFIASYFLVGRAMVLWQPSNQIGLEIVMGSMALITLWITRSFILNFLAWLIGNGVLYFVIYNHQIGWLFHLLLIFQWTAFLYACQKETQMMLAKGFWKARFKSFRYAMYGAIAMSTFFLIIRQDGIYNIPFPWLSAVPPILLIIWFSYRKLKELGIAQPLPWVLMMLVALSLTIQAPYLACWLLLLLVGFGFGDRLMWMIAVVMCIFSIGKFYYDLEYTLLTKSLCMMGAGVVLGAIYYVTSSKLKVDEPH